jgi:hypothetical protein
MTYAPPWITVLSALLTPTIACLGAWIAYRQWRTAQNKLRLDLFDRRFCVYEVTKNFLACIVKNGKTSDEETCKFLVATREARWLLNANVATYLRDELYNKVIDLQTLQSELGGSMTDEDRAENIKRQAEIKKWLISQYKVLDEKLSPFLVVQA